MPPASHGKINHHPKHLRLYILYAVCGALIFSYTLILKCLPKRSDDFRESVAAVLPHPPPRHASIGAKPDKFT